MRRHPVAVYRIIDEEELLGGGDFELSSRRDLADIDPRSRALGRERRRRWSGWGWTTLGVVALASIAGLLLTVSPRERVPVPARSPKSGISTPSRRVLSVVPAPLPAHTRPLTHPLRGPTRRVIVQRAQREQTRGLAGTVTRPAVVIAVSRDRRAVTPALPSAADLEFGFER